jgi:hypothetical protein
MHAVATLLDGRFEPQRMRGALGEEMADALSHHMCSRAFLVQAAEKRCLVSLPSFALPHVSFVALLPLLRLLLFAHWHMLLFFFFFFASSCVAPVD